jgi:hypothetical protein
MRELVAMAVAGAVLGAVAGSSTASHAAVGGNVAPAVDAATPVERVAGCYRWGEYGYRWYPFCVGPRWLYPHQRVCRHGYCWYR